MALMENVVRVGKTYKVRKRIPPECRAVFNISGEFVTVSLHTTDKREARERAIPVLADIEAKIAAVRGEPSKAASPPPRFNPATAFDAIQRWRLASINSAYDAAWNGSAPSASDRGRLRYALQAHDRISDIPDFTDRLIDALRSQGVEVGADHPAVAKPTLREWFREAWADVEDFTDRFSRDDFNGWPEHQDAPLPKPIVQGGASVPLAGMKISELRDAWDAVKPLESRQRGYIKRLIEFLGDRDIATVEPLDMDRFLIDLKRFPMIRKPVEDIPFGQLVGAFPNAPRLHVMTVWKWTTVFKAMFEFAVSRRLLSHNPASAMMRKPGAEERTEKDPFDAADMNLIFSTPTFTGHTGRRDGYRDKPGEVVTKDDFYWLIVLAAATGMRLEEMASLKRSEVIREGELVGFDLTARPIGGPNGVKNSWSRRIVPVSKALTATGFVDWLDQGKGEFVFASLKADAKGDRGTAFGKWFALWSTANAPIKGSGIDAPLKSLHSFRHTFKLAARVSGAKEEIHNLITGHNDGNVVARGYGRGADRRGVGLAVLKRVVDEIEIPGLNLLRQ